VAIDEGQVRYPLAATRLERWTRFTLLVIPLLLVLVATHFMLAAGGSGEVGFLSLGEALGALLLAGLRVVATRRGRRAIRRRDYLVCPACGYSLKGLPRFDCCPECGLLCKPEEVIQMWKRRYRVP